MMNDEFGSFPTLDKQYSRKNRAHVLGYNVALILTQSFSFKLTICPNKYVPIRITRNHFTILPESKTQHVLGLRVFLKEK